MAGDLFFMGGLGSGIGRPRWLLDGEDQVSRPDQCRAFAPGSIGNLACGFDVLGLALEGPGDEVVARRVSEPGLRISGIFGDGGRLSSEISENTAGAAVRALMVSQRIDVGLDLQVHKGLPLAGGMGGSAASAVAAVFAVNELLGIGLNGDTLLEYALVGETEAAGAPSPDNAAPSLFGGLVLVPSWEPIRAIELEVPRELMAVHVHPHMEVETEGARKVLGNRVLLPDAIAQWGNTAALVTGLFREDWDIIARSVVDRVAEPLRSPAVPGFQEVKLAALNAGALAASLSGSGPSLFALCRGRESAMRVGERMVTAFRQAAGLKADLIVSSGRAPGARILAN